MSIDLIIRIKTKRRARNVVLVLDYEYLDLLSIKHNLVERGS